MGSTGLGRVLCSHLPAKSPLLNQKGLWQPNQTSNPTSNKPRQEINENHWNRPGQTQPAQRREKRNASERRPGASASITPRRSPGSGASTTTRRHGGSRLSGGGAAPAAPAPRWPWLVPGGVLRAWVNLKQDENRRCRFFWGDT